MEMNSNVDKLFFEQAGPMVFCALNAIMLDNVKLKVVIAFNVIAVIIKPHFYQGLSKNKPNFHGVSGF